MEAAAAAGEFEEAAKLRDQLSLLRGQPNPAAPADFDTSRLKRQVPGKMGLGTSEQAMVPPAGVDAAKAAGPDDDRDQDRQATPAIGLAAVQPRGVSDQPPPRAL